ncbi:MAG: glycoside hydrolase, partial [Acidimicrobiales bacterium]
MSETAEANCIDMKTVKMQLLTALISSFLIGCAASDNSDSASVSIETLEAEFINPPQSAQPRTWFHVMSGNMTKAGITKDLESIKSVGIGGVLLFNVTQGIPVGPVKFNSDEHIELIRYMARETERLGLSFGVHNCDGWTSSGGPWITPEISMKKVVWSETLVNGGRVDAVLPQPDSFKGYYEDIATIAYPSLPGELENQTNRPKITSPQPDLDINVITDGIVSVLRAVTLLDGTEDAPGRLDIEYAKPFPLQTINLRFENARLANVLLLSSQDGVNYTPVKHLALRRPGKDDWGNDEALSKPVTARYFRLETKVPLALKEIKLSAVPSIGNMWGRTGAARTTYSDLPPIGSAASTSIIDSSSVIDLSAQVNASGQLLVDLPDGNWTIMRFGQTSTGAWNLPASEEGIGLEVDKFSQSALKVHYDAYMTNVINAVKDVAPNAHQYTQIDSYEVGAQNWTTGYEKIFEDEKNYSLVPFLPLFAGRFVDSADVSERVTWDMRDLSNTLMQENYYGYFKELANDDGLQLYVEPYGDGPFNEVDAGGVADIPMGEFWVNRFGNRVNAAVSAAHIYGKPIASAEAFTDIWDVNWKFHPAYAKTIGDANWALGVNEFMFHRFAHQANTNVKPGMTMNRWGSHFDRTQTWWDGAGAEYFKYISRGQHLLRQGIPVNDALLFLGDGAPTTCPEREKEKSIPRSLNFVCLNADVLQNRLSISDDGFTLPAGGTHRFLILQDSEIITQASLDALDELSNNGTGFIIGEPPQNLAGFVQTPAEREAFA